MRSTSAPSAAKKRRFCVERRELGRAEIHERVRHPEDGGIGKGATFTMKLPG